MKRLSLISLLCLCLTGCNIPWRSVTASLNYLNAGGSPAGLINVVGNHHDSHNESWWDNNDEHFSWMWWPFN